MSSPSIQSRKILDIENLVSCVRSLNEAVFMAAGSLADRDQMNAIQSVVDEIQSKLLAIGDRLEEVREAIS